LTAVFFRPIHYAHYVTQV